MVHRSDSGVLIATAITYSRFGGPDVLTVSQVSVPEPGPGQLRVQVLAIGVNLIDAKIRSGQLPVPTEFPVIPGFDVAGIVDAVGAGRTDFEIGTAVFGTAVSGAYADYALMDGGWIWPKPAGLSWEVAAALPTIAETAFRALQHLDLHTGETLLVHGAAGGVGATATQLAISRGVRVVASVGEADLAFVRSLGATAIHYGDGLVERVRAVSPSGVDAVLDTSGAGVLADSVELAGGGGRVITTVDGRAPEFGATFTGPDPSDRTPEGVPIVADMVAAGALSVRIGTTYPLSEAVAAHTALESHTGGKIILVPSRPATAPT